MKKSADLDMMNDILSDVHFMSSIVIFRKVVVVDRNGSIEYVDRGFKAGCEESYAALSAALKGIPR